MLFAERCVYDQFQTFVLKHGMVIRIHFAIGEFLFGFLAAFRNQVRDGGDFIVVGTVFPGYEDLYKGDTEGLCEGIRKQILGLRIA